MTGSLKHLEAVFPNLARAGYSPKSEPSAVLGNLEDIIHQTPLAVAGPDPAYGEDRKSTRLNSSHIQKSRMPSSA